MLYHALNTPLNAIIMGADIVRNESHGSNIKEYRMHLDAIYDAGMQLKCFTTDLIYPEPIDIKDIIGKCVKIQKKYAISHGIELVADIPDNIPLIRADKLRFRQIILSTLYHSMYYVIKGGHTEITANVEYNSDNSPAVLIISITDNGWGYDEEMREKFWRENYGNEFDSYSRNPDMMKLSIATIKHFMKLHMGSLDLQNFPNKGSVFTICMPFTETEDSVNIQNGVIINKDSKKKTTKSTSNIFHFPKKNAKI
jgi:hypothetical protein